MLNVSYTANFSQSADEELELMVDVGKKVAFESTFVCKRYGAALLAESSQDSNAKQESLEGYVREASWKWTLKSQDYDARKGRVCPRVDVKNES